MQLLLTYVTGECACCGRPILFGEGTHDTTDGDVCDECREERYRKCAECGEVHPFDELTKIDGSYLCDDCRDNEYAKCAYCGDWHLRDDMTHVDCEDNYVCDECYNDHYFTCEDCERVYRLGDGSYATTHGGRLVCDSCRDRHYFTCADCGELWPDDDCCYCEREDENYCPNCIDDHEKEVDVRGIIDYHDFPKDLYVPRFTQEETLGGKRTKELTFGVELECDGGCFSADAFDGWFEDDSLIHFEYDGSLSSEGVECITQPCSLRYHQERMDWPAICGALVTQGFKSHATDCCGLHVHIGRSRIPPSVIPKMDVFINRADRFFGAIARRSVFYSSHYDTQKRLRKSKGQRWGTHDDRYQAVNTTNANTVEIRIFRGTLKPETILGTVEMLHALVHFLEGVSSARIYETERNVLKFVDYCGGHAEEYPHVMPMFARLLERDGVSEYLPNVQNWMTKIEKKNKRKEPKKCA